MNSLRYPARAAALLAAAALTACAGGRSAPEPIYELRATEAPLRYELQSEQRTVIELPTGDEQDVSSSSRAVLSLTYEARNDAGLPFVLTFEELDLEVPGMPQTPDVSGVLGEPIRGTVADDGTITVDEAPELDIPGFDAGSLAEMVTPLAVPLPPDGNPDAESWPLERTREVTGEMTGRTQFDGEARFAPETEWEGRPVRIIVSDGDLRQRVSGQPPGSPGEVDVDLRGDATSRYVWDPLRGVALHVEQEVELEGTIGLQMMALPMTSSVTQTYDLLP